MSDHIAIPLATASYNEYAPDLGAPVRTSLGAPRWFPYPIVLSWNNIMPDRWMLNIDDEQRYRDKYLAKLDRIGVETLRGDIDALAEGHAYSHMGEVPNRLVLLCYEKLSKPGNWCHRSMFAQWWADNTGEWVEELGAQPRPAETFNPEPPSLF